MNTQIKLVLMIAIATLNCAFASEYISPDIEKGEKFTRSNSTAYLECSEIREFPDQGFGHFSFNIIAKENTLHVGQKVGKIGVSYRQKNSAGSHNERTVELGSLEVENKYRLNGYGEAALRTVLGIFRSKKRENLQFDRFWLTVGLGQSRVEARKLYTKVGFKIEEIMLNIGYQNMSLERTPQQSN